MIYRCRVEDWALKTPFVIAREVIERLPVIYLEIEHEGVIGRAEAVGVDYHGETPEGVLDMINSTLGALSEFPSRALINSMLSAGGARNAIDCALWDLDAKRVGQRVWQLAGLTDVKPLQTAYTLSIGTPEAMRDAAALLPEMATIKLKLGKDPATDLDRVAAIRQIKPMARLIVDANEGWTVQDLNKLAPGFSEHRIALVEQPIRAGTDDALVDYTGSIPLCADESFDTRDSLGVMVHYQCANIKLDKTGGLTEALACVDALRSMGKDIFVGSMLGTSLGMAPAFLIGQFCEYIDLDGALLLKNDRAMVCGTTTSPFTRSGQRFGGRIVF